jgi:hypothetical protein
MYKEMEEVRKTRLFLSAVIFPSGEVIMCYMVNHVHKKLGDTTRIAARIFETKF